MSEEVGEITTFLRHIGDDVVPAGVEVSPECMEQVDKEGFCPYHGDCGICRFEYMKKKGWLNLKPLGEGK